MEWVEMISKTERNRCKNTYLIISNKNEENQTQENQND